MILKRTKKSKLTRTEVKKDKDKIYIFTDNCNRTSGSFNIPDNSEYSIRFGKTGLKHPSKTSAILRGLYNALPITTQKTYVPGVASYKGNWKDEDFEEFKKVIDDDFEYIKKVCKERKIDTVIFPYNGVLNGTTSRITIERTPKLYQYIIEKEIELKNFEI